MLPMMEKTMAVVLAGGMGSRLHPLTKDRAKPAVPFGGKYRIIDFCLANCVHSGLRRVLVLTQYKSHSLQKHLRDGWSVFNPEFGEFITPVPAQMRTGNEWYAGTADAIYQNLYLLERNAAEHVVILSGDHIYRMDYSALLAFHLEKEAAVTVAGKVMPLEDARQFGVMALDNDGRVTTFQEKPEYPITLPGDELQAMASMGIYVFSLDKLRSILEHDHRQRGSSHDFGKDVLPDIVASERVFAYRFGGHSGRVSPDNYWRDVGTIDAYFDANMDLLNPLPSLDLYQADWPIRTYQEQSPPARTVPGNSGNEGISINSIIGAGTVIAGGSVQHSVLFQDVYVGDEAHLRDAIIFPRVRIGDGVQLQRCIIDKDVTVPAGEIIGFDRDADRRRFTVSEEGVVVIPKGYRFPRD